MEGYDLYREPLGSKQGEQMEMVGSTIAHQHAEQHAISTLSNASEEMLGSIGYPYGYNYDYGGYLVDICLIYAMISFLAVVVLTKIYTGVYRDAKEHEKKEEESYGNS